MKKIVKSLLLMLFLLPMLGGWANAEQFKPATLINFKTGYRVAVYSDSQAQRYFSLGYELDRGLLGFSVVTNYSTTLSSSITATQTTIPVGTTKDKKGEQLATSTLGMKIYLNIEPGGNKEELVVCTGISGNNWTGCTRGLAFSGTDESAVSSYQYAHSAGSRVVMSNIHYVYQNFVDLDSNQTITGNKTFSGTANFTGGVSNFTNIPTTSTSTPTANNQIVTKGYVDGIVVAGGVTMSTTTPGIAKISSDPSNPLNPVVLNSEEVSNTSGADKVVRAGSTGLIDDSFVNHSNQTFTGTTTINNGFVPTSTPTLPGQIVGLNDNYVIPNSILQIFATSSDNIKLYSNATSTWSGTGNGTLKDIIIPTTGNIKIKFYCYDSGNGDRNTLSIVNSVGTSRELISCDGGGTGYELIEQTTSVSMGDHIKITWNNSGSGSYNGGVYNFGIYYDYSFATSSLVIQ